MNKKLIISLSIVIVFFLVVIGLKFFSTEDDWLCVDGKWLKHGSPSSQMPTTICDDNVSEIENTEYINNEHGFIFRLPNTWQGYFIIKDTWTGNLITDSSNSNYSGPKIIIRHPLWTEENPRQDIPVMIFTPYEWSLILQESLAIGAAPIAPSEIGRNDKYIFALPARYNYAFPVGYEEVENILQSNSLVAF